MANAGKKKCQKPDALYNPQENEIRVESRVIKKTVIMRNVSKHEKHHLAQHRTKFHCKERLHVSHYKTGLPLNRLAATQSARNTGKATTLGQNSNNAYLCIS